MYKIIENEDSLLKWEAETKNTLKLWENVSARNHINEMVQELDNCYGADRNIILTTDEICREYRAGRMPQSGQIPYAAVCIILY